jgi:pseudouridine-5'-phosphate glycosidase
MEGVLQVAPEVRDALAIGRAVVALETSVVAHGLAPPANLDAARRCTLAVRQAGAVPAFIALVEGCVVVGATEDELERLARSGADTAKAGVRDLAALLHARRNAGTTVSATVAIAAQVGIRVMATGGLGGVHRAAADDGALRDVSSDLAELSSCPVCVVAAGPKAILDVAATAEQLESLCVPVIGYRTSDLPAFYVAQSGMRLEHRVEDPASAAALLRLHWQVLRRREGVLLCVSPPSPLPAAQVEAALASALTDARSRGLGGKQLTPWLLQALDRATQGETRAANVLLLEENARVAGEIAANLAGA